jgi:hypothetical protein
MAKKILVKRNIAIFFLQGLILIPYVIIVGVILFIIGGKQIVKRWAFHINLSWALFHYKRSPKRPLEQIRGVLSKP